MTYKLYQMQDSGNCYKVRLLLSLLQEEFETVETNILNGESRTDEFLERNPIGKVPALEIGPGNYLAESSAILWYLAEDSQYLPKTRLARAQVLQWLSFEQYSHEPFIATSRFWISLLKQPEKFAKQIEEKHAPGLAALSVMEKHLGDNAYFVDTYSIADIALFAYTHICHEGGYSLAAFPAIQAWIKRIESNPLHISITERGNS